MSAYSGSRAQWSRAHLKATNPCVGEGGLAEGTPDTDVKLRQVASLFMGSQISFWPVIISKEWIKLSLHKALSHQSRVHYSIYENSTQVK